MKPHRHDWQDYWVYDDHMYECTGCGMLRWRPGCEICGEQDCDEHAVCPKCDERTSAENPCDCKWNKGN